MISLSFRASTFLFFLSPACPSPPFPAQALHYLETISPGPLLVQLLSSVLGLSVFILEEACASIDDMSAAKVRYPT